MALPLYLALTSAERSENLPERMAYLACHFAPGGQVLSNLPTRLPPDAMLILDDSMPMSDHDPERIASQLSELITRFGCDSLLLDFQRPHFAPQQALAKLLCDTLPCPVGVSELYADSLPCPVFLPPVPPDKPLCEYLAPWKGRDIWLEAALEGVTLALTEEGCDAAPLFDVPEMGFWEEKLHCHYTVQQSGQAAVFHLWRTREDLLGLLFHAADSGVSRAVGLWQELCI